MASGLLRLRGIADLEGWKWLFIIDGILTLIVAVMTWYVFRIMVSLKWSEIYRRLQVLFTRWSIGYKGWDARTETVVYWTRNTDIGYKTGEGRPIETFVWVRQS